jgi:hypothetical protein
MTASLVAITEEQRTPAAREERLRDRLADANRAIVSEIDSYDDPRQLQTLLNEFRYAFANQCAYWQRRALKAERQLRAVLGKDLTDEQREMVFSTLQIDRSRDRTLLSEYEQELIRQYRRMDGRGTMMVRELFNILAANAKVEG